MLIMTYFIDRYYKGTYLEEFWRCVRRRPAECVEVLVYLLHLGGKAKVSHFDIEVGRSGSEEHIFGL